MHGLEPVIYGERDRVEHIMGMPIGIDVRDQDVDPVALDRAFDWFRFVDETFSTFKPDSEISRINRRELTLAGAHADVCAILDRCEELRLETNGYFDIRNPYLPGVIDPSGLVKGWSVDRAGQILEAAGAGNYCINAGGDVIVCGRAIPEPSWRIGIQHPFQRDCVAAVVESTTRLAIATSGAYARGEHIVDPHTGWSPSGILSATIVGAELATADAYATAAYAMGAEGPEWTRTLVAAGFEAMIILADQTVLSTPGFPFARDENADPSEDAGYS